MHTLFSKTFLIAAMLVSQTACASPLRKGGELERQEHASIIKELKTTSDGKKLIRIISDENHEVPDPTRPELIELPNGQKKYVIGFSGQNIMMLDNLEQLVAGGIKPVHNVMLVNKYGHQYGGEIDPVSAKPYGYAFDSSTWDVGVFKYVKADGSTGLKVLAGAMGTATDGKPLLIKDGHNNTRQRLFFEGEFRETPSGFKLFASNPMAPLNKGTPVKGNWIEKNAKGKITFSHGYGGEPVTLQNGDLFVDHRGWVPFVHETVVEQREEQRADGSINKIPYRTAVVVTYFNKTLSKVMQPTKIIFDVFKSNGVVWAAANRPTAGPLVEGAHIEIQHQGKPVQSMSDVKKLQARGEKLDFQMLFSAGEYFGHYGSYMAYSQGNLENFKAMTDDKGELLDITAPLRVLFTWIGRPVSFHVGNQEYLMLHGVDRSSLPEGIKLDQRPQHHEWQYFKRQEMIVPIERTFENGMMKLKIKDDSGLIERLKQYRPRKISLRVPMEHSPAA